MAVAELLMTLSELAFELLMFILLAESSSRPGVVSAPYLDEAVRLESLRCRVSDTNELAETHQQ